jgi:putative addiction module component (TIGR02574 family)
VKVDSKKVLADALQLLPAERASLIEDLLSSFNFPGRDEIDNLWACEVEDRIEAYDRGEMGSVPATQIFEKLNQQRK